MGQQSGPTKQDATKAHCSAGRGQGGKRSGREEGDADVPSDNIAGKEDANHGLADRQESEGQQLQTQGERLLRGSEAWAWCLAPAGLADGGQSK